MHLHHFTLLNLAKALQKDWADAALSACFSQSRDELVIGLEKGEAEIFLRVSCEPSFSYICPSSDFRKARKNTVNLFPELIGNCVNEFQAPPGERLLLMKFDGDYTLALKMHGMQSNVILLKAGKAQRIFRETLKGDEQFIPSAGSFDADWPEKSHQPAADQVAAALKQISPCLDKHFTAFAEQGMQQGKPFGECVAEALALARSGEYWLSLSGSELKFRLLPPADQERQLKIRGVMAALQAFVRSRFVFDKYNREYLRLAAPLGKQIKKMSDLVSSARKGLGTAAVERNPEEVGNLIMAQLHLISKGQTEAELEDYYLGGKLRVNLKPELDAQQNATLYYQKAKKLKTRVQHLQIQLEENSRNLEKLLETEAGLKKFPAPGELTLSVTGIDGSVLRELESFVSDHEEQVRAGGSSESKETKHPFLEFSKGGYSIFVGRSARSNDELTFHFSRREDLWLHVKDAPGSHVIIRQRPGQVFPRPVIEYAASLAAAYSSRKTEGLVPVSVTPRKYVRKLKGAAAGAVVVDREEIVLVEPGTRSN